MHQGFIPFVLAGLLLAAPVAVAAPKPETGLALPTPLSEPLPAPQPTEPVAEPESAPETSPEAGEAPAAPKATISYDLSALPAPVAETRAKLLEIAASGEIEALRPILEANQNGVMVSFGGAEDPIAYWKEVSGDHKGLELLAIMIEILNQGYAVMNADDGSALYVWPYFHAVDITTLTDKQLVELYMLIPPHDVEDMLNFGGYLFYRLGISADGTMQFMIAGD